MKLLYESVRVRRGKREILKGVSLEVEKGRMTGLIGPNGCGKSTLVKTTLRLFPAVSGKILLEGQPIAQYPPRELASQIGYVGQETNFAFDFSVAEVVVMGLYARKDRPASPKEAVCQALAEMQIPHLHDRSILSLSGGERKLALIARALVQGADTLILDEPTNHLDIHHQLFLLDYLKRSGKTILIVLHDLRLAAHYCDSLVLLSEGIKIVQGSPLEVLCEQNVSNTFGITGHAYYNANGQADFDLFP